jgi:hypothetical protein
VFPPFLQLVLLLFPPLSPDGRDPDPPPSPRPVCPRPPRLCLRPNADHKVFDFNLVAAANYLEQTGLTPIAAPRVYAELFQKLKNVYFLVIFL